MNGGYTYAADRLVVEKLLLLSRRDRNRLLQAFEHLADNPFHKPELELERAGLSPVQVNHFGQWLVNWWPDHAVREVRIIGFNRIALRS